MSTDVLITMTGLPADADALQAALALARSDGGHVLAVVPLQLPPPVGAWGINVDPALMQQVHVEARRAAEADADALRTRLAAEDVATEVRTVETYLGEPHHAVVEQARCTDIAVVAAPRDGDGSTVRACRRLFSGLLMEAGRPVMVVPRAHRASSVPRHAVVAWRPTRDAARAVHDALPLLRQADTVDVVRIDEPSSTSSSDPARDAEQLAAHLGRHGLRVQVVVRPLGAGTVADALLAHCADTGADLLVAGGFGHSRLREWALGGTTRDLLEAAHLPVLFSH